MPAFDPVTPRFHDREAVKYAAASRVGSRLPSFLSRLAPGARILELGCGAGHDAQAMQGAGFRVTATDGSPALAAEAEKRIAGGVTVRRFDQLDEEDLFDAVWANACLLHVPAAELAPILRKVWLALRGDGLFFASFKAGRAKAAAAIALIAITLFRARTRRAAPMSRPAPGPISTSAARSAAATTASSGRG